MVVDKVRAFNQSLNVRWWFGSTIKPVSLLLNSPFSIPLRVEVNYRNNRFFLHKSLVFRSYGISCNELLYAIHITTKLRIMIDFRIQIHLHTN